LLTSDRSFGTKAGLPEVLVVVSIVELGLQLEYWKRMRLMDWWVLIALYQQRLSQRVSAVSFRPQLNQSVLIGKCPK
jgi:hypothetical protein